MRAARHRRLGLGRMGRIARAPPRTVAGTSSPPQFVQPTGGEAPPGGETNDRSEDEEAGAAGTSRGELAASRENPSPPEAPPHRTTGATLRNRNRRLLRLANGGDDRSGEMTMTAGTNDDGVDTGRRRVDDGVEGRPEGGGS